MPLLPDHASPECHVGRYRFTSHPNYDRAELFNLSSRMHRKFSRTINEKICAPSRPKWRNPPVIYTMVEHSQIRRLEEYILFECSEAAQDERTATV